MIAPTKLWIDAQLPLVLARSLREALDVEVVHVVEVGLVAASDRAIFDSASTVGHVVMTKDADFAHLVSQRGPPPQVVHVTCGNVRNAELLTMVRSAWPLCETLLVQGEPLVEIGGRGPVGGA